MNKQLDEDLRSVMAVLYGVRLDTLIVTCAGQRNKPIDSDMKAFWAALCAVAEDVDADCLEVVTALRRDRTR